MLASILIGLAALIAVSLSSALFLFAHLTGRVRRSTALAVAMAVVTIGGGVAISGAAGSVIFMAVPFGVFLMLAAAVNGFLAYQSPRA